MASTSGHSYACATREQIISSDALWDSLEKCVRGVSWKPSVKSFRLNAVERIYGMNKELSEGEWKSGKPRPILITAPKRREGLSVSFRDRVYQRALNDLALYPAATETFIRNNAACQKEKGPDFARGTMKGLLKGHFHRHGLQGFVVQADIKGYYKNMRHDITENMFRAFLPQDIHEMATEVMRAQYAGDTGYSPGSQMIQIAGISFLNGLDHYITEDLGIPAYIRYMDDFILLHRSREVLEDALEKIRAYLAGIGLCLHEKKTRLFPISRAFTFLGFRFRLTGGGKPLMFLTRENVRRERRRLRRLTALYHKGLRTKKKVMECYSSWRNHACKGDSERLIMKMDSYIKTLMETPHAA